MRNNSIGVTQLKNRTLRKPARSKGVKRLTPLLRAGFRILIGFVFNNKQFNCVTPIQIQIIY